MTGMFSSVMRNLPRAAWRLNRRCSVTQVLGVDNGMISALTMQVRWSASIGDKIRSMFENLSYENYSLGARLWVSSRQAMVARFDVQNLTNSQTYWNRSWKWLLPNRKQQRFPSRQRGEEVRDRTMKKKKMKTSRSKYNNITETGAVIKQSKNRCKRAAITEVKATEEVEAALKG